MRDITNTVTEVIETTSTTGEKQSKRMPNTTFEMVGIPVSSTIFFENDPLKPAMVKDNINKVEYKGKTYRYGIVVSNNFFCHNLQKKEVNS